MTNEEILIEALEYFAGMHGFKLERYRQQNKNKTRNSPSTSSCSLFSTSF